MNDELLVKFLLNETTAEETTEVQKWMSASAENEKYYQQFERIWKESETLAQTQEVDEEAAWQRFKQRVVEKETAVTPIVKKLKPAKIFWRIAAVFVFCLGSWLAYQQFLGYTNITSSDLVINQKLPDGSRLVLNKNTSISYATDFKTNRKVEIKSGEVFFEVEHDRIHPFIIDVNNIKVEVEGTSFNIKKQANAVEVIVETGTVKVFKNAKGLGSGKELRLTKGESILLGDDGGLSVKRQIEDELYNYYRTELFVANNTPLARLITILKDAYGTDISLSEEVKNYRISTTLPFKYSLEKNLETICETLDLKMQRNPNQILLSKK